jgi:uncharacterized protein (DUF952 family)
VSRARPIYHLAPESELLAGACNGSYSPRGLATDGFVHCSGSREIALAVAADYFGDLAEPLYVLEIDPRRLRHELRFEAAAPAAGAARSHLARADRFPHVYGPLDLAAITGAGRLGGRGAARAWPDSRQPLDHWLSLGPIELADHDPGWLQCAAYRYRRDVESYTNSKSEFIESILRKAGAARQAP